MKALGSPPRAFLHFTMEEIILFFAGFLLIREIVNVTKV